MTNNIYEHYRAVLDDLQSRRNELMEEVRRVDLLMEGMRERLSETAGSPHKQKDGASSEKGDKTAKIARPYNYGRMSVRWGVLAHLAEGTSGSAKTAQIASALREGGYQSEGASFSNIVSGVLSTLKARGEVEGSTEEGYRLTTAGMASWHHIKSSPKFNIQQTNGGELLDNA